MKYEVWRHLKTGGLYTVLAKAVVEATGEEVVVYQGQDGRVWTRPSPQFYDERFEPINRLAYIQWIAVLQEKIAQAQKHLEDQKKSTTGDLNWYLSDVQAAELRLAHLQELLLLANRAFVALLSQAEAQFTLLDEGKS